MRRRAATARYLHAAIRYERMYSETALNTGSCVFIKEEEEEKKLNQKNDRFFARRRIVIPVGALFRLLYSVVISFSVRWCVTHVSLSMFSSLLPSILTSASSSSVRQCSVQATSIRNSDRRSRSRAAPVYVFTHACLGVDRRRRDFR